MEYSKIPFHVLDDRKIFPGKIYYLLYPDSDDEGSVFIHPDSFSLLDQDADSIFIRNFGDRYFLFCCLSGDGTLQYQGKPVLFSKGMGFFLDGASLSEIASGSMGAQYTVYMMTGALAEELQKLSWERHAFAFDSGSFHDFEQRQFLLVKNFPGTLHGREYDFSCHMNHLLVRILQARPISAPEKDKHRQMIQQALTYMQAHLSENINIKDLAARFHYSTSQFQKCFQEQTLCSAKQYLIQIRMQEAEKLLLCSNLSIEEICTRCGFNNANHFIRAFREYYGATPLQYRKSNRRSSAY